MIQFHQTRDQVLLHLINKVIQIGTPKRTVPLNPTIETNTQLGNPVINIKLLTQALIM